MGYIIRTRQQRPTSTAGKVWAGLVLVAGLLLLTTVCVRDTQAQSAAKGPGSSRSMQRPEPTARTQVKSAAPDTIGWTNLYPYDLNQVSAVSATEAWAAGTNGRLLHFTGGSWAAVDPPQMQGVDLIDIEMLSANSGWISAGDHAFQYDGTTWRDHPPADGPLENISALSADDVWGVAGWGIDAAELYHWDGVTWTRLEVPTSEKIDNVSLTDVSMAGTSDGWGVGYGYTCYGHNLCNNYVITVRYTGSSWARVYGAPLLTRISAPAPGTAWAIGGGNTIARYSNGTWSQSYTPDLSIPADIKMVSVTDGWAITNRSVLHWDGSSWSVVYKNGEFMKGITEAGGQAWAVGTADTILSGGSGSEWAQQYGGPTTNSLRSVAVLPGGDAWAGGDQGTFLKYDTVTDRWQRVPSDLGDDVAVQSMQMLSPTDGYAVGGPYGGGISPGFIAHWDGAAWTQIMTTDVRLNSISMLDSINGWAVGDAGLMMRDTGGVWAQVDSPTSHHLSTVAMDSPYHGWAGGGDVHDCGPFACIVEHVLLEWDGSKWVDRSSTLTTPLPLPERFLVAHGNTWMLSGWRCIDPPSYLACSEISHLDGSTWNRSLSANDLHGIAMEANGEVWAAGSMIGCHYVRGTWNCQLLPTRERIRDLALTPGRGGWAVGDGGIILRYNALAAGQRFYDVPLGSTFFPYIECMASRNIISGYSEDNTFRPDITVTRGQIAKIVSRAAGFTEEPGDPIFTDVPASSTFYAYVNRLARRGVMAGYNDVASCPTGVPCFHPESITTRGQLSKIVSNSAGYDNTPGVQTFEDVPPASPFYIWIERLAGRGIMNGYPCGGDGEPCVGPEYRGYFRPNGSATRGQASKIVSNSFFSGCSTLGATPARLLKP